MKRGFSKFTDSAPVSAARMKKLMKEAIRAGALLRAEYLRKHGGQYSLREAARKLGLNLSETRQLAQQGRILGIRKPKSKTLTFPVFQFSKQNSGLIPGLNLVLEELNEPYLNGWSKCHFLFSPRDSLGGKSPLALLRKGKVEKVVALAGAYAS